MLLTEQTQIVAIKTPFTDCYYEVGHDSSSESSVNVSRVVISLLNVYLNTGKPNVTKSDNTRSTPVILTVSVLPLLSKAKERCLINQTTTKSLRISQGQTGGHLSFHACPGNVC